MGGGVYRWDSTLEVISEPEWCDIGVPTTNLEFIFADCACDLMWQTCDSKMLCAPLCELKPYQ